MGKKAASKASTNTSSTNKASTSARAKAARARVLKDKNKDTTTNSAPKQSANKPNKNPKDNEDNSNPGDNVIVVNTPNPLNSSSSLNPNFGTLSQEELQRENADLRARLVQQENQRNKEFEEGLDLNSVAQSIQGNNLDAQLDEAARQQTRELLEEVRQLKGTKTLT